MLIENFRLILSPALRAHRLVLTMVDEQIDTAALESVPFGVALPLLEAISSCRLTCVWLSAVELMGF